MSSCGGSTAWAFLKHLIQLIEDLADGGVGFRSLSEGMDSTTSGGKLIVSIFGALAEFERSLIRERTMAGLASARARGRVGGRPPVMTPEKVKVARQLYDAQELTVEEIPRTIASVERPCIAICPRVVRYERRRGCRVGRCRFGAKPQRHRIKRHRCGAHRRFLPTSFCLCVGVPFGDVPIGPGHTGGDCRIGRLTVTCGEECPSRVCAVFTPTPERIRAVAASERRSWKRSPGRR